MPIAELKTKAAKNELEKDSPLSGVLETESVDFLYKKECETEQSLLSHLLKNQARLKKLQKDTKQVEKECKRIEKSKLWKLMSPYWKIFELRNKAFQFLPFYCKLTKLYQENVTLKEENSNLLERLNKLSSEESIKIAMQPQESGQLNKVIKASKEDGSFIEYLETLIQNKTNQVEQYNSALKYAAKLYKNENPVLKSYVYNKVLPALSIEDVPEFIIRNEEEISLQPLASFRANLSGRLRTKQLGEPLPEWVLDNKMAAYEFVDQLGVRRPWVSKMIYSYEDLLKDHSVVIKPVDGAGSRGVYLVFEENHIQDVRRGEVLNSWDELTSKMKMDLNSGWVSKDEWMIEELIVTNSHSKSSPRDLKFYCFYGEVALVLEIERYPELKYCWWTPDGNPIHTGKYEDDLFIGAGFKAEDIERVRKISLEIPSPFMRIDFLKSGTEMIFGEFTPKPGNYDEFDSNTDTRLGDCFLRAESRLLNDLIKGKQFHYYNQQFISSEKYVSTK